jgi:RimJ/RimL family protein N-acetyltransferase
VVSGLSSKPTLVGDRVVLRPFRSSDYTAIREGLRDPETHRLTGSDDFGEWDAATDERVRRWYETRNAQPDRLDLAVVDRDRDDCVGEVVLNEWDVRNSSCNFRIMLVPAGRDRGLGTEAVRLIVGYGFEQVGLHRIALQVYAFNPRARHVYERVGFVAEGMLRDALRHDGTWIDATVMSILADEWEKHRGRP